MIDFKDDKRRQPEKYAPFLILQNLMETKQFSILDLKLILTEDYFRYALSPFANKLVSYGNKYYLNFQGMRLINRKQRQSFYTKNHIKYEDLGTQKQFIRKLFRNWKADSVDKETMIKVEKKTRRILELLKQYEVTFDSSSVLVLYDPFTRNFNVKFLDFSYLPNSANKSSFLGVEIFLKVLKEIITENDNL